MIDFFSQIRLTPILCELKSCHVNSNMFCGSVALIKHFTKLIPEQKNVVVMSTLMTCALYSQDSKVPVGVIEATDLTEIMRQHYAGN